MKHKEMIMRFNRTMKLSRLLLILAVTLAATAVAQEAAPEGLEIGTLEVAGNVTLSREEVFSEVRARPAPTESASNGRGIIGQRPRAA